MLDPTSIDPIVAVFAGGSYVAAKAAGTALQSAVDYALAPLQALTELRKDEFKENRVRRVAQAAQHASGTSILLQPNDRVLARVLSEAALVDDHLVADYLGGLIAGSGSEDDRSIPFTSLVVQMSAQQIRLHYMCYAAVRKAVQDTRMDAAFFDDSDFGGLWGPTLSIILEARHCAFLAPDFGRSPTPGMGRAIRADRAMVASVLGSLARLGLVRAEPLGVLPKKASGSVGTLKLTFSPTPSGAELFLWAHGIGPLLGMNKWFQQGHANRMFDPDLQLTVLTELPDVPVLDKWVELDLPKEL